MKQKISKADWLQFHGFGVSPFDALKAEVEFASHPDIMIRSFVEPPGFDRILGSMESSEHIILFAESGMGGSTCRFIVDDLIRNSELFRKNSQRVLSVPFTNFANVYALALAEARSARKREEGGKTEQEVPVLVSFSHHLYEITSRMISAFADLVRREENLRLAIVALPQDEKQFVAQLIAPLDAYLDASQTRLLNDVGISWPTTIGAQSDDHHKEVFITDGDTFWLMKNLELFARWLRGLDIIKIYLLIDEVDTIEPAAVNSLLVMDVLRPLFSNLSPLGTTYGIVFKLFLPAQLKNFIVLDPEIDLGANLGLLDLIWSKESLLKILRERLAVCKKDLDHDRTATSFDLFCSHDLRGRIEDELIRVASGNPRKLLSACATLLDIHCSREHSPDHLYWLTADDWKLTIERLSLPQVAQYDLSKGFPVTPEQVVELIAIGENSELEFKSSVRWDTVHQKINKALFDVIAKTITGMLNSNGGFLLIGVKDDGQILGVEQDVSTIKPPTLDAYERFLIDSIRDYIGLVVCQT